MGAYGDSQGVTDMLGGLFSSVLLEPPPLAEQTAILAASHPTLPPEVNLASMSALHVCQRAGGHEAPLQDPGGLPQGWNLTVDDAMATAGLRAGDLATSFGHHFSLRDLLKLCARLQVSHTFRISAIAGCLTSVGHVHLILLCRVCAVCCILSRLWQTGTSCCTHLLCVQSSLDADWMLEVTLNKVLKFYASTGHTWGFGAALISGGICWC